MPTSTTTPSTGSGCACIVSFEDGSIRIPCGTTSCRNGMLRSCVSGTMQVLGACNGTIDSTGCPFFLCARTLDCEGTGLCFSTASTGQNYCYVYWGQNHESPCPEDGGAPFTRATNLGTSSICSRPACPDPVTFIP